MDTQDFRSLQEAYMEVVENQQLDEAEKVIRMRGEFKKPQPLNVTQDPDRRKKRVQKTMDRLEKGRQETNRFAQAASRNLMRQKESFDLYDIILSHLIDEGYVETPEAAEVIMVNMSEGWMRSIVG